jgi:hypothetical protein
MIDFPVPSSVFDRHDRSEPASTAADQRGLVGVASWLAFRWQGIRVTTLGMKIERGGERYFRLGSGLRIKIGMETTVVRWFKAHTCTFQVFLFCFVFFGVNLDDNGT